MALPSAGQVFPKSPLSQAAAKAKPAGGGSSFESASAGGQLPSIYDALHNAPTPPKTASPTPPSSSTSNNAPTAPVGGEYSIGTDPVLAQTQAYSQAANAQAHAAALAQEQQALLQYGDPTLAASILGANDPFVKEAGQNQESTLAQMARDYAQQQRQFNETIDPSLVNSGYRVEQLHNMGQAYQDQLAKAAAQIQQELTGIRGTEGQAEAANNQALSKAISDAYNRQLAMALSSAPAAASTNPIIAALLGGSGG